MRLLSYNIHKGIGGRDRRYRLERIIAAIEHENPDLIGLQEVDRGCKRSKLDDQPRILAEQFAAGGHLFQLNVRSGDGGYGNLILSRWPIVSSHQISLRLEKKKPRGAQIAVVDTPEGRLTIAHTHLGLAERERHWQVRHLLGHHLFLAESIGPTIVFGDLNDWRNTLASGPFREYEFQAIATPPSRFRSFPAWLPIGSLDKAFHRGGVVVHEARVSRSAITKQASDHLPLVIDLHLEVGQ
jgi:endonuclease/exonuclease/phosphatase family metal-dependent hydrolase